MCRAWWVEWMNAWGFKPLLRTYMLNWARRTSWGCWDEWNDTALQTQDEKFEPGQSEAEHATSRSRSPPHNIESLRVSREETFVSLKPYCQSGVLSKQTALTTAQFNLLGYTTDLLWWSSNKRYILHRAPTQSCWLATGVCPFKRK